AHPEWSAVQTRHFAEQPGAFWRWPVPSRRDVCGDVLAEQHLTRPGLLEALGSGPGRAWQLLSPTQRPGNAKQ
ncbi:MAG: hypothetical protein ACYCUD_14180, partial [Candidatus Dormibacteria bacterium]